LIFSAARQREKKQENKNAIVAAQKLFVRGGSGSWPLARRTHHFSSPALHVGGGSQVVRSACEPEFRSKRRGGAGDRVDE